MNLQMFRIERNIRQIKTLHELGKISAKDAKKEILRLSKDVNDILLSLPEAERSLYRRKRIMI